MAHGDPAPTALERSPRVSSVFTSACSTHGDNLSSRASSSICGVSDSLRSTSVTLSPAFKLGESSRIET